MSVSFLRAGDAEPFVREGRFAYRLSAPQLHVMRQFPCGVCALRAVEPAPRQERIIAAARHGFVLKLTVDVHARAAASYRPFVAAITLLTTLEPHFACIVRQLVSAYHCMLHFVTP